MDELLEGPQWPELFQAEEKEDLQAMFDIAELVAAYRDSATCGRPVNENVLERFVFEKMDEPY